jgi:hypothetical protein
VLWRKRKRPRSTVEREEVIGADRADLFASAIAGGTSTKLGVDGPEPEIRRVGTLALAGFVVSIVIPSLAILLVFLPLQGFLEAQVA